MPTRFTALVLCVTWIAAVCALFWRDILPEWRAAQPPDLGQVAVLPRDSGPSRWRILVRDPRSGEGSEMVGRLITLRQADPDGSTTLQSDAVLRVGRLFNETPIAVDDQTVLAISSACRVSPAGELVQLTVELRETADASRPLLVIVGTREGSNLVLEATSPIPVWKWRMKLPYKPSGLVQSSLGPFDFMPGLRVGQRWESSVVNPLTGQAQVCSVEVVARRHITWNQNPVPAFVLETRMSPFTAKTWVRGDGLVMRQEVPTPLRVLILEREPP